LQYESVLTDENIGWPSYVDFLASFAFVLILFVTWSVNLIAGVERERVIRADLERMQGDFNSAGFEAVIEGTKLRIPLGNKVVFVLSKADLDDIAKTHLREAGRMIAANPDVRRIVVMGYADKVRPTRDEFFNWKVSVDRAEAVLRFLYLCTDCGYRPEDVRPKLVLHGEGDLDSRQLGVAEQLTGEPSDRRVDIVLDRSDDERP
jgi:flagellar motor protein MotB